MAIPEDILAVARPKSTIVRQRGNRYVVIKRTSKRINGKPVPVDLGTVGEIVNGEFVEGSYTRKKYGVDIKDYGEVALCDKFGKGLLHELAKVWNLDDAKRLYVIALLRASYGDIMNRDLQIQYLCSFASELYPGVHLSETATAGFLVEIGKAYSLICEFMRNRVSAFTGGNMVIDGMLKDYNAKTGSLSEFSRKGAKKGSKDISLLYAFNPLTREPIAAKPYTGNMLDQTAIDDFVAEYEIKNGLMVFDKGFYNEKLFERVDRMDGLDYLIPLKQNSAFIKNYKMDEPTQPLKDYKDGTILYKKERMSNGKFLYSFRDPKAASEQEIGYVQQANKKNNFKAENYAEKKSLFGLIVFKSKADLDPLIVYLAYAQRWSVETLFWLYKNIVDRDTVNVHSDYSVYATELINFLSVVITTRVKNEFVKLELNKKYSYKEIFRYLSKYKKVRTKEGGKWSTATMLKYIEELVTVLGV